MIKKLVGLVLLVFPLLLVTPVLAQEASPSSVATSSAKNLVQEEVVTLRENEVVNKDYFAWGEKVDILGVINGDAYIAGGNVNIDGVINGDLLVAGGNIEIRGRVTGNIRTAGGDINISGEVGRSVTALGGSINLEKSARVGGSLVAAGGEVDIQSPVEKDVTLAAGDANVGNNVGNGLLAGVGNLTLNSGARINGDVNYWSDNKLIRNEGASVSGQINHNIPERGVSEGAESFFDAIGAAFTAISTLAYLLIGLLFIRFFPTFSQKTADLISNNPLKSLGIGVLATILVPVVFILLLITVIGIPLALILLFGFIILAYISTVFVSLFIGQKLLDMVNKKTSPYLAFIVGLLVFELLSAIPVVGIFVSLAGFFIGTGAIVIAKKHYYDLLRSKDSI